MAHRSKKKHLKHMHEHEPVTPKPRSPIVKARAAAAGIAKKNGGSRRAQEATGATKGTAKNGTAKTGKTGTGKTGTGKKKGIVRRLAAKARKRIMARPRRAVAKVKARVKSLLGRAEA